MGANSKIEWCDHTFNPWIGCQKVSPGCDHCYAEAEWDHRYHRVQWGPHGERSRTSVDYWKQPHRWNRQAAAAGRRAQVFCASLADVSDNRVPGEWREDLFRLIAETPALDWMLLTKRPENITRMLPPAWPWANVWLGTTTEDQQHFDLRWPILGKIPAVVHFVSYEPALGPLRLGSADPDWIIAGGESGPGRRPMDLAWARDLRDQCAAAGIAFFMKQVDKVKQIPPDLMVRQWPNPRDISSKAPRI
jgi:protein gp37